MSYSDIDHATRVGVHSSERRQSQAESISSLWSSADVPFYLDTRPTLGAISEQKSALDAPISLGPVDSDCSHGAQGLLLGQEFSPPLDINSTPRTSVDRIPAFLSGNGSPSSFAASRYGRKPSQDSPRRRPPPLQLQNSNTFQQAGPQCSMIAASLSYGSQMTMMPDMAQPTTPALPGYAAPTLPPLQSTQSPAAATKSPSSNRQQPTLRKRRSSLKKTSSKSALVIPDQPMPTTINPSLRNRLYAQADRYFDAGYSLTAPMVQPTLQTSPVSQPLSAPPTTFGQYRFNVPSRKSSFSLSSDAHCPSRDNSVPGSLSLTSTSSGYTSSNGCFTSDGDLSTSPSCMSVLSAQKQASPFDYEPKIALGPYGKPAKARGGLSGLGPKHIYPSKPPTPHRSSSQQHLQALPPPAPASLLPTGMDAPLPRLSTQYLGGRPTEDFPHPPQQMALPTPVSPLGEVSNLNSSAAASPPLDRQYPFAPSQELQPAPFLRTSVSPTQRFTEGLSEQPSSRFRTVSASRLLAAAYAKVPHTGNWPEAGLLSSPKRSLGTQRPSTATTDGCHLRPRARTVGERERPMSLQPAAFIHEKVERVPQELDKAPSTMTSAASHGRSPLSFRPKSKGGWASHLSGGLTLHIDQDGQRPVQLKLGYLNYDPFGTIESLTPNVDENARPTTPKQSLRSKVDVDDQTGILDFGPTAASEDGWVFNSGAGTSAAMLRHLTVGPDLKADVLTRQARLSLCTDGVHEVCGSENKGKLAWRFIYRVDPCLASMGRPVASGEKILRPIKFLCSATLLEPSRAQKSRLINRVRKQVNANLVSTPVRSPASAATRVGTMMVTSSSSSSLMPSPMAASVEAPTTNVGMYQQSPHSDSLQAQHLGHHFRLLRTPQTISQNVQKTPVATEVAASTEQPSHGLAIQAPRARQLPSSITLAKSTTSLVSPLPSPTFQRLDPTQVSVPANLPAGVVPFKIVRPLNTKPSNTSLRVTAEPVCGSQGQQDAAWKSQAAPFGALRLSGIAPDAAQEQGCPPTNIASPNATGVGIHSAPVARPAHTTAANSTISPSQQQMGPSTGKLGRRLRSHTGDERRMRRPMTASELIKREWEDKQREQDTRSVSSAAWPRAGLDQSSLKTDALAPRSMLTRPRTSVTKGDRCPGDVTILTPQSFNSRGERRRSRTVGAWSDRSGFARPFTADPTAHDAINTGALPPLPWSATERSFAQPHHGLQPRIEVSALHPQDGRYPSLVQPRSSDGTHYGQLSQGWQERELLPTSRSTSGTGSTSAMSISSDVDLQKEAISALLRQMPTTIVQPPREGVAPVPPKRVSRRPRTAQNLSELTRSLPGVGGAEGPSFGGQGCAKPPGSSAAVYGGLKPPSTPLQCSLVAATASKGPTRSASFGVSPLVNFSPEKCAT